MAFVALTVVFTVAPARVESHGLKKEGVHVSNVWARATIMSAKTGAAYMMIKNNGYAADKLIAIETRISKKASVHQSKVVDGVMHMNAVKKLIIKPGATVMLKLGGYHVMFMGLNNGLKQGDTFPITLVFEKSGPVVVTVTVMKAGGRDIDHNAMKKTKTTANE